MKLRTLHGLWLGLALTVALPAMAQDQMRDQTQATDREQMRDQQMYGYQLMSPAEQEAYRERLRTATTAQERERIRAEQHQQMQQRARERGVTLPDEQPTQGPRQGGMAPGSGMGSGGNMGSGGGMAPRGRH